MSYNHNYNELLKLQIQNKNLLKLLTNSEIQLHNLKKEFKEMELKYTKEIKDLNKINKELTSKLGLFEEILSQNYELKEQLQSTERIKEVNLDRSYRKLIWEEVYKQPGMFFELRTMEGRKYERFIINTKLIKLTDVIITKIIFTGIEFTKINRKLTDYEIKLLTEDGRLYILNQGSQITGLPAYDVIVDVMNEEDEERFSKILNENTSLPKDKREKRRFKKPEHEIEKLEKTVSEQKQRIGELEKQIKVNTNVNYNNNGNNNVNNQNQTLQISQINDNNTQNRLQEPIYNKPSQQQKISVRVPISLKDVYTGQGKVTFKIYNQQYSIDIPLGIKNGEIREYKLIYNNQEIIVVVNFAYNKQIFTNWSRVNNDLYGTLIYSKEYYQMTTNLMLFDISTNYKVNIFPGQFKINGLGFVDGNIKGDLIITIMLQ